MITTEGTLDIKEWSPSHATVDCLCCPTACIPASLKPIHFPPGPCGRRIHWAQVNTVIPGCYPEVTDLAQNLQRPSWNSIILIFLGGQGS
ncbi:hypothetical protein NPIL_272921 [Nephila pilipes]|uniref:Uncharacterized protein n=1 Tax=Nephila pilipes TaxID=299642 RepID=A0A8X6UFW9_NEPPI|nr:hypothetical protein NPIL_272921 [Nephila pilipes]